MLKKIISVTVVVTILVLLSIPLTCSVDGWGNSKTISPNKTVSTIHKGNIWLVEIGRKIHYIPPKIYDDEINDKMDNISTYYFPFSVPKYFYIVGNKLSF